MLNGIPVAGNTGQEQVILRYLEVLNMGMNESSISAEKKHYYSSSQGPFHNANNILMFFGGGGRGELVEATINSLRQSESVIRITGEPGSGKTMLSLVLADRLKHRHNIIRYDLPLVSQAFMLRHLLIEVCPDKAQAIGVGREVDEAIIKKGVENLTAALKEGASRERPYLLIIDSQSNIDADCLRMLNNIMQSQKNENPILQVLIFSRKNASSASSPATLQSDSVKKAGHYTLRRLSLSEINEYLAHHMMLFDFNQRNVFTREMAYFIADRSEGVFRSINTLARNAFMVASLEDASQVTMSHLLTAGLPVPTEPDVTDRFVFRHRRLIVSLLGFSVLGSLALLVFAS